MTRNQLLATLVLLACFVTMTYAQTDQARLAGVVKDASGAVIPGAKITVRNEKTGAERTADSDAQGRFVITNLLPAPYTVTCKSENLGPTIVSVAALQVGEARD